MKFQELALNERLQKALADLGFETPTPIQEQAIPELLTSDRDLLGLAQTGTGKTAAFGLPILQKIDENINKPQAIILSPTRELCMQITEDLKRYAKYYTNLKTLAIYGGASIIPQIKDLRKGVQIIVATPGRLIDVIERGEINFDNIKIAVLDEADEMLNMGFKEDMNLILSKTPENKSTWLFSATMPKEIRMIANKFMENPIEVKIAANKSNDNIEHEYYVVKPQYKYAALKRILDFNPDIFGIVFSNTKHEAKDIAELLIKDGYNADALHGDLSQQQRDVVMNRYRERSLQILVATDVAARGIDVSNVTHVVHYSIPDDIENYTHRSGRTARAGKTGISAALVTSRTIGKIREIERLVGKRFNKAEVPTGFDVCEKQLFAIIKRAHDVEVNDEQISPYIDKINKEFEGMTKEDVIKRFASLEFNRFLEYYKTAPNLNETGERRERTEGVRSENAMPRFFINVGSIDDLNRGDLLRIICDTSGIEGSSVGRIDIKGTFSFFEVEATASDAILSSFNTLELFGRKVRVELTKEDRGGGDRRSSNRFGGGERRERSSSNRFGGGERRERSSSFGGDRNERREGGNRERKPFNGGERTERPRREFGNSNNSSRSFDKPTERKPRTERTYDKPFTKSAPEKKTTNKFPYELKDLSF